MTTGPRELSLAPAQVCGSGGEWAVQVRVGTPAHQGGGAGAPVCSMLSVIRGYVQKLSSFSWTNPYSLGKWLKKIIAKTHRFQIH